MHMRESRERGRGEGRERGGEGEGGREGGRVQAKEEREAGTTHAPMRCSYRSGMSSDTRQRQSAARGCVCPARRRQA